MLKKYLLWATLTILNTLLSACVSFAPIKTPNIHTYVLQDPTAELQKQLSYPCTKASSDNYSLPTLSIGQASALSGYATTRMAYLYSNTQQINYYAQNRWFIPPHLTISNVLAHSLEVSGAFQAVLSDFTNLSGSQQLSMQLIELVQKFDQEKKSTLLLSLNVILVDPNKHKTWSQRFSATIPAAPNPAGQVIATQQALKQLIPVIVKFIILHTRSYECLAD